MNFPSFPLPSPAGFVPLLLLVASLIPVPGSAIDFFGNGPEVHVSQGTVRLQWTPKVARLTDGRFVVVWDDDGFIKARLFNSDTTAVDDEIDVDVIPYASNNSFSPDVAALPDGGFIVTWQAYMDQTSVLDVFARAFDSTAAGITPTIRVNETTVNAQNRPSVEVFDNGKILFVFQSDSGHPTGWDIKYRIFNSNMTPTDSDLHLATDHNADQFRPKLARLADGSIVAVWDTEEFDPISVATRTNVRARRIGSGGALGDVYLVNTDVEGNQGSPSVASLGSDGFVVAWTNDTVFGDLANERGEIRFQRFSYNSTTDVITPVGAETQVNTVTNGSQVESSIAGWNNGFVVSWTSENNNRYAGDTDIATSEDGSGAGVFARGYDLSGTPQVVPFRINLTVLNHQYQSTMAALNDFAVIAWTSKGQDGDSDGVYLRRIQTDPGMVPADPDPTGVLPTPPIPPTLSTTTPSSIVFRASRTGKLPRARTFSVRNRGDSNLYWRVSRKPAWARVTPASGVLAPNKARPIRFSLIRSKLPKRGKVIRGRLRFDALGNGRGDRSVWLTLRRPR